MKEKDQRIAIVESLGWRRVDPKTLKKCTWPVWRSPEGTNESILTNTLPNPTEDLRFAIQLCDVVAREGWRTELNQGTGGGWECVFWRDKPRRIDYYCPHDSLALAICGAYLRLRGLWVESSVN